MTAMSNLRWVIAAVAAVAVLAVAGPFVYIHFVEGDPPAALSLDDVTTSTSTTAGGGAAAREGIDGRWTVAAGSQAGYRVSEVLFGQDAVAVGRTEDVTGSLTITGTSVTDGSFAVDLTTVSSDQSRRDGQFHDRIMQTSRFPTATFALTKPIDLGSTPVDGAEVRSRATGDLTVHGVKRSVTFDVTAKRTSGTIAINGAIPVVFADYGIGDPSFGPATVQDHGVIEFLLVLNPST
jgi:polyisoprenoid-binding protein YceI